MRDLWGASQKAPPKRGAMTVSQLNQRVKSLLERQHPQVTVIGELSAPRVSGGHCYFKLKDGGGVVAGVMFRSQLSRVGLPRRARTSGGHRRAGHPLSTERAVSNRRRKDDASRPG